MKTIAYNDISSQYPYELSRKLLYKDYHFVENLMNKSTDKIKIMAAFCFVR